MTAEELYSKLIEIKKSKPSYQFCELDLLPFGNVEEQMEQLINEGKIEKSEDILDSFTVLS